MTVSAEVSERRQLNSSTAAQVERYIKMVGLDPNAENVLINRYGILREKCFAGLSDQSLFAFVLLLCEKRAEFDQFTRELPNIFGLKQ